MVKFTLHSVKVYNIPPFCLQFQTERQKENRKGDGLWWMFLALTLSGEKSQRKVAPPFFFFKVRAFAEKPGSTGTD